MNNCCLLYYWMCYFDHLLIGWNNHLSLLLSFYNSVVIIFKRSRSRIIFKGFFFGLVFSRNSISKIVLWSFIFDLNVVDFWLFVCVNRISANWSWKLSSGVLGRIQTVHTYFLRLQDCGRLWRGFRLVVTAFLHQLITLLGLKSPSSYSH